ncbi:hypothetical protein [Marinomonas gallaica]|uniref:hypothetical protein n=1 Tax=Marinomonas gallaica TaxID=1806667 RepID=UPI003A941E6E
MKTLTNAFTFAKKGTLAAAIAAASMTASVAYADYDGDGCSMIEKQEVAMEKAKADNDWSAIVGAQMELSTAKTECWINKNMNEDNAEDKWNDIKDSFNEGMEDLHDEYDEQVENAKDAYEEAKEEADTDEAMEEAKETYDDTMESISESYNESVAALKDKLGIDE